MPKKRRIIVCVMLMLSILNYSRIQGIENIRSVQFLSIFAIGALAGILMQDLGQRIKRQEKRDTQKV